MCVSRDFERLSVKISWVTISEYCVHPDFVSIALRTVEAKRSTLAPHLSLVREPHHIEEQREEGFVHRLRIRLHTDNLTRLLVQV